MTLDELRNKRHGAQQQVTYWSRKVAELDKQIREASRRTVAVAETIDRIERDRADPSNLQGVWSNE